MAEKKRAGRYKDPANTKNIIRGMIQEFCDENPGASDYEVMAYLLKRGYRRDKRSVATHRQRINEEIARHHRLDTKHWGDDEKDVWRDLQMLDEFIVEASNDRSWSSVASLIARKHNITKPEETWKKKLSDDRAAAERKIEITFVNSKDEVDGGSDEA